MIYIVEVPHRLPAVCWIAHDRDDFVSIINQAARRGGECLDTFDECVQWTASDLHSLAVFETAREAAQALNSHPIFGGHQGSKAEHALKTQLAFYGEIELLSDVGDKS